MSPTNATNTQIRPEREWTVDTLKAYFDAVHAESDRRYVALITDADRRHDEHMRTSAAARDAADTRYLSMFAAQEKAVAAALAAAEAAVNKAEAAAEKRFDSVNEFRAQLADQAATFMPRAESENRHAATAEKLGDIMHRLDKSEGRSVGVSTSWGALAATAGIVIAALSIILRVILPT